MANSRMKGKHILWFGEKVGYLILRFSSCSSCYLSCKSKCWYGCIFPDKEEVDDLRRRVLILGVIAGVAALFAIVATIVAAASFITHGDGDCCHKDSNNNGMTALTPGAVAGQAGSACSNIECLHGGSCVNIYPNNFICACVATSRCPG